MSFELSLAQVGNLQEIPRVQKWTKERAEDFQGLIPSDTNNLDTAIHVDMDRANAQSSNKSYQELAFFFSV